MIELLNCIARRPDAVRWSEAFVEKQNLLIVFCKRDLNLQFWLSPCSKLEAGRIADPLGYETYTIAEFRRCENTDGHTRPFAEI